VLEVVEVVVAIGVVELVVLEVDEVEVEVEVVVVAAGVVVVVVGAIVVVVVVGASVVVEVVVVVGAFVVVDVVVVGAGVVVVVVGAAVVVVVVVVVVQSPPDKVGAPAGQLGSEMLPIGQPKLVGSELQFVGVPPYGVCVMVQVMSPVTGFKLPVTDAEPVGVLSSEPDQEGTPPE